MSYTDQGLLAPILNNSAAASSNTAAIQAVLDTGGRVELVGSGDCFINDTLVIRSRTQLHVPPKLKITQVTGTNKKLLANAAYNAPFAPVTVSWTAGVLATITQSGHGRTKGDFVWLRGVAGTAQSQYSGVFQITQVSDANTFVVRLRRRPTAAPAGTFECKSADVDISIEGGIWDYNGTENSGATALDTMGLVLGSVHGLRLRGIEGRDARKYVLCLGAVSDFVVEDLFSPGTRSDGVKVYGPAFDGVVDGITGYFNDDICSIQPQEAAPYAQYDFTGGGDAINVTVRNISALSENASLAVLYGSTNQYADNILFENVSGKSYSPLIRLVNGSGFSNCQIGRVKVRNVEWQDNTNQPVVTIAGGQLFASIDIDGILGLPATAMPSYTSDLIFIGSGSNGNLLRVAGVRAFLGSSSAALSLNSSVFSEVVFEDNSLAGSSSGTAILLTGAGAGARRLHVRNNRFASLGLGVSLASSAAATTHAIFSANDANCSNALIFPSAACKISLRDNRLVTMNNGVVRANGAVAISIFSEGNTLESGSWLTVAGGALVSVFGDDFATDVTLLQRTNGSFVFNSNSAAGTLGAAGRVTCQGTITDSWHLLSDPSLRY